MIYRTRQGGSPASGEQHRLHALVEQTVRLDVVSDVESDALTHPGGGGGGGGGGDDDGDDDGDVMMFEDTIRWVF